MVDWGRGEYEQTAQELAPAAARVIGVAQVAPGERVLDLGTGTGNAALLAARAGADVTAVDPAPRLLGVARERLAEEGLGGTVAVERADLVMEAASPEDWVERFESGHPAGMLFRDVLGAAGGYGEARAGALAALREGNEADTGLRVTGRYLVFTIAAA